MMIIMMARLLLLLSSTLSIQLSLEHIKYTFMHAHLCKLNRSLAVDEDTHIFIGGLSAKAHSLPTSHFSNVAIAVVQCK